jgi:hypothetical protein
MALDLGGHLRSEHTRTARAPPIRQLLTANRFVQAAMKQEVGSDRGGRSASADLAPPADGLLSLHSLVLLAYSPLSPIRCSGRGDAMTETVEVDEQTYRSLEFAARMSGCTAGEMVARLVAEASLPAPTAREETEHPEGASGVAVYAHYEGHRTHGRYDPKTTRIDITSGPLTGRSFKTPTGAARAVVTHYKPGVNPNRNGWSFWVLDDGSGKFLQSIRGTS